MISNTVRLKVNSSQLIGHIFTSRFEKYRKETENWLKKHNISYDKLHMLNVRKAQG